MDKRAFLFFSVVVLLSVIVLAQPPTPYSVQGTIYLIDGSTQVPLGTSFTINNTDSGDFLRSATSFPVPTFTGLFSEVVDGFDGDQVIIRAWNDTHYGENNITLAGDVSGIIVILNNTRPSETNITITSPANNSIFNVTSPFNISASVTVLGADGGSCSAILNISNNAIVGLIDGQTTTNSLGSLNRGDTTTTFWTVNATSIGSSTFTVRGSCANDDFALEKQNAYTINVTFINALAPLVTLQKPINNTLNKSTNNISFEFIVQTGEGIKNCTLSLNDQLNVSNETAISVGSPYQFNVSLPNGDYNWSVQCADASQDIGFSGVYNLSIAVFHPSILISLTDPIDLLAGSTQTVYCNATVTDLNGNADINESSASAIFYDVTQSSPGDVDDNNYHYTNSSCSQTSAVGNQKGVSCAFSLQYYANQGNWNCTFSIADIQGLANSSNESTVINELLAIETDPYLSYGLLSPGEISSSDISLNMRNVGNREFNITVEGYAEVRNDNLSMYCTSGNVSIHNQHYDIISGKVFANMQNLTWNASLIENLTLPQRTNDIAIDTDENVTYWKVETPSDVSGRCNGTILMAAAI